MNTLVPDAAPAAATLRDRAGRVLVVGYGSPIRGDDAIGPLVADRLIDEIDSEQIVVYSRHILTAELVAEVAEAGLAIFLDATIEGLPGQVQCRPIAADPAATLSMAHFLDPRELLAWAVALYGRSPEAHLITATGQCFDYAGYRLSPTAAAAVQPMIDCTRQLIDGYLARFPTFCTAEASACAPQTETLHAAMPTG